MQTMRSVLCTEPGRVEIVERPVPTPDSHEVLIETRAVGLCTSDIYVLLGQTPDAQFPTERFGHEPAGIVAEVGSGVTRLKPGDRVTSLWCRGGFMQFAEYYVQEESFVFPLPDEVPFSHGLCEPLAAAARGICGAGILPGDTVAVVGAGYFGQLIAQAARLLGAWLGCRAVWWSLYNANGIQEWAVMRSEDLTPRPAWFSAQYTSAVLDDVRAAREIEPQIVGEAPDDLVVRPFQNSPGDVLIALWRTSPSEDACEPVTVTLDLPGVPADGGDIRDLLYGCRQRARIDATADGVRVADLLVGDWPIVVRLGNDT